MVCCSHSGTPFSQTKFLGASIVDFSASADFGGTGGGLSCNLVQDTCDGNSKVYVDSNGSLQTTTDADSFLPSGVGSPVYFYYGGLYYGGLLSDWQESNSADGPKIYSVNVTSPRQIVENTQVILQSYCGSVFGVPNLLNVHGYLNSLCGTCLETGFLTTYPMFGMGAPLTYTPTGSWCKTSETGWTWTSVSNALLMMLGGAGGAYGGVLEYRGYTYTLDISDLPALNDQIRINNESMSLADLIDYICGLAGVDYFYELTPAAAGGAVCGTSGQLGGGIHSIKVVVGNSPYQSFEQSAQDVNDAVCTAIDTRLDYGVIASNIGAANCVNRYSRGLQTRNEFSTAFITGEYRQDVWQMQYNGGCDGEDTIWPYWGKDNEGNVILGEGCDFGDFDVETTHKFTLDISHLDVGPATWEVTMPELRAALVGETNWRAWCLEKEVTKFSGLGTTAEYKIPAEGFIANALSDAILNNADPDIAGMKAPDLLNMGNVEMGEKTTTESWRKGSVLYDFIRKYAQEYYGKKFMVKLPFMCKAVDTDEPYSFANSWLPSDGGWTEWPVLGYATNSPQVMFFRGDDGRVGCFARYLSTEPLIIDNLSKEDVYPISMYECLVRGTVEDIVWVTPNDARAVIQISGPVRQLHESGVLPDWLLMLALVGEDVDKFENVFRSPANDKVNLGMEYQLLLPTSVAVPLQSQKLVYGPWLYSNIDDFDYYGLGSVFNGDDYGMTHYERDPELAPWNYGSFYLMNYAGHSIATSRVGDKFVSEKGEITFPGGPAGSLGSAIAAGGPIISNIDVQVGRGNGEVLTTYRMKTYVPDWGQMGKARVDMIRRASKMGMKVYNLFRHKIVKRHHDISIRQVEQDLLEWRKTHQFDASSSHEYFDGAAYRDPDDSSHARTTVSITEPRKSSVLMRPDSNNFYTRRAGVEAIGLFRPFSTKTATGSDAAYFPRFEDHVHDTSCPTGESEYMKNNTDYFSKEQVPPIFCKEDHLPIVVGTLSPFLAGNKSVVSGADGICMNDGAAGVGHDIEYVVRDGVYPTHLNVRHPSGNYSSSHWYRSVALRGPLVLAGWGYDIDNKPVPNNSSSYPNNPEMKFKEGWLRKPHEWKCGPVDLRWDYNRKVWTAPTPHKIVRMELQDTLCPDGCSSAILYEDQVQYDREGSAIATATGCAGAVGYNVTVYSNAMKAVPKGWNITAMYDTTYDRYHMLGHDDFPMVEVTLDEHIDCAATGSGTIDNVAGNSIDPCSALDGLPITLKNPLGEALCTGTKVIAWVDNFTCSGTGTASPILNDCSNQCSTLSSAQGVIVESERQSFWAKITGGDDAGKYSWVAIDWDDAYFMQSNVNCGTGTYTGYGYAIEENFSPYIPTSTEEVVLLRKQGRVGSSGCYYVFHYDAAKNGVTTSSITAASGTIPGTGTFTIYDFDGIDLSSTSDSGFTLYNRYTGATGITSSTNIRVKFDDGYWWLEGADC